MEFEACSAYRRAWSLATRTGKMSRPPHADMDSKKPSLFVVVPVYISESSLRAVGDEKGASAFACRASDRDGHALPAGLTSTAFAPRETKGEAH